MRVLTFGENEVVEFFDRELLLKINVNHSLVKDFLKTFKNVILQYKEDSFLDSSFTQIKNFHLLLY